MSNFDFLYSFFNVCFPIISNRTRPQSSYSVRLRFKYTTLGVGGSPPSVSVDNFAKTAGLSAIFLRKNKEQPDSWAAPQHAT